MRHVLLLPLNFGLKLVSHRRQLVTYFRGVCDGLTGRIERRYQAQVSTEPQFPNDPSTGLGTLSCLLWARRLRLWVN